MIITDGWVAVGSPPEPLDGIWVTTAFGGRFAGVGFFVGVAPGPGRILEGRVGGTIVRVGTTMVGKGVRKMVGFGA